MVAQLQAFLEDTNILDPFQSGFCPAHRTETMLVTLVDELLRHLDRGGSVLLILFDLSLVFSIVDHKLLTHRFVDSFAERLLLPDGGGGGGAAPTMPGETPRRSSGSSGSSTYFRRVSPAWMLLVAAGLTYVGWAVFSPATIPYDSLGPLGTFTRCLVENHKALLNVGYAVAWIVHVAETIYALKLCRDKGITDPSTQFWWAAQTFLVGVASLIHLLNYDPLKETKRQ
ncbi:PREDICTED: transmembrane protein 254-like [Gekko japonicus]|uniref:Transmembrane protein 254 n=1 Tax=Gekko japonicus TaxID=146911 RepID=A0ABM1KZ83_GEKJA|nr:PREDICTED: transmembrane protein 254-like [Gekko japonicus]